MDTVFGIGFGNAASRIEKLKVSVVSEKDIPEEIQQLITERDVARTERNFERADEFRSKIEEKGFQIEDSPEGTVVKRI